MLPVILQIKDTKEHFEMLEKSWNGHTVAHIYIPLPTAEITTRAAAWLAQYNHMAEVCEIIQHQGTNVMHLKPKPEPFANVGVSVSQIYDKQNMGGKSVFVVYFGDANNQKNAALAFNVAMDFAKILDSNFPESVSNEKGLNWGDFCLSDQWWSNISFNPVTSHVHMNIDTQSLLNEFIPHQEMEASAPLDDRDALLARIAELEQMLADKDAQIHAQAQTIEQLSHNHDQVPPAGQYLISDEM